ARVTGGVVVPLPGRSPHGAASHAVLVTQAQMASAARPPVKVLAVLPFRSLLTEQHDEALVMGMAETLIARLGNGPEIAVRPLSLTRRYDTPERDPLAAGRELGADIVLDGGLQRDAGGLRVTARLLRVRDGVALWSGRFDVEFTGVFDVQDVIAEHAADALALRLGADGKQRLTRRDTDNVDAYQCYLTGRHHIAKLTPPEIRKGIAMFERAIALDPRYARAYAGAADAYRRLPIACDWRPTEAFPQAQAAALEALALDATVAEAHFALGFVRFWYDWRWAEADKEFRRAIELDPGSAEPHLGLGHLLSNLGRQSEAIAEIRRARELDPLSLIANTLEASFLSLAQRDDDALACLRRAFDIDPDFWVTHLHLGGIHFKMGRSAEAIAALQRARIHSDNAPQTIAALGYVLARGADSKGAHACLRELYDLEAHRYVPPANFAVVYCGLGDAGHSLKWLERAYSERDVRLTFLKIDRRWDALRGNSQFAALAKRMDLE
ncbi:MAG TPA: tetratricopeptide repeat protein, partial [Casimicrobiaceae bacterium]